MGSVLSGAVIYAASYLFTILTIDLLPPLSQLPAATVGGLLCLLGHFLAVGSP